LDEACPACGTPDEGNVCCLVCETHLPGPARRLRRGIAETQEMLDFCGQHNITADVEVIPIQKINEAYERMVRSDVKYRFSIDMASLRSE
jgi:hypothetical protein